MSACARGDARAWNDLVERYQRLVYSIPRRYGLSIAVASTDAGDVKSSFSNYGDHVDLCAPGVEIVGTLPGTGYGSANGTSYSCPLVAGVAALVLQMEPGMTHAALVARLKESAVFIDHLNPNYQGMLGAGRIHAYAAVTTGCYPDCNGVGGLTIADFGCFQTKFVAGDPYADCNGVGGLTIADFGCFQTKFVAGCP